MQLIEYPALAAHAARYAELEMEPLRVTAVLRANAQVAHYDYPHLENVLAWAVVQEATTGRGLPPREGAAYRLPLPLRPLWRSPDGWPLWASTPLLPIGDQATDVIYWHKRLFPGRWSGGKRGKFVPNPTAGRWMERRTPLPTILCRHWQATCIGNAAEIARLLSAVTHLGKKRGIGLGEVEQWQIESAAEFTLVREGLLLRPLPQAAWGELLPGEEEPDEIPTPVGWTPPQWLPGLWLDGWREGTPVATRASASDSQPGMPDWL